MYRQVSDIGSIDSDVVDDVGEVSDVGGDLLEPPAKEPSPVCTPPPSEDGGSDVVPPLGGHGGASSSGGPAVVVPPPLPPPPASVASSVGDRAGGRRQKPDATAVFQNRGRVSFYSGSNNKFEAVCSRHPNCKLTRTSNPPARPGPKTADQGRPLGLMAAWLLFDPADGSDGFDEHAHKHLFVIHSLCGDFDRRQHCRALVEGLAGGQDLFEHERDQGKDPETEPRTVPCFLA